MAGIYIHIPFCRQKCNYCDFYKTVNTDLTSTFLLALKKEILKQKNYLENEIINTIYFGGGTPSILKEKELEQIIKDLNAKFIVNKNAEITFEANPDDLDDNYLSSLKHVGINRLSIGVQSFQNTHLKKMNRRHNAKQAIVSIENAAKKGFQDISIDLIYGLPELKKKDWTDSLKEVFQLPVQHLSAYHLTFHQGTPFYTWLKKGSLKELNESESIWQFNQLINSSNKNDFEHYEISNFAKNQHYSKHNTSYWTGEKYLGLGPSAHSFNGSSRQWNISHLERYLNALHKNQPYFEEETLTEKEKFNEYILTRIRTKWGVSLNEIEVNFGQDKLNHFLKNAKKNIKTNLLMEEKGIFTLTRKGLFVSDEIMANFMII